MANDYYNTSGYPAYAANGDSASARTEFAAIDAGFSKLPALTGMGLRIVRVNAGGTALESVAYTTANIFALDGSTTPTADLPMGGYKLTGLGAATTNGDAVRYEQVGDLAIEQTHAAANKTTPVDADEVAIADSAATYGLKRLTLANLKSYIQTAFGSVFADKTTTDSHIANTSNPHAVTASQATFTPTGNITSTDAQAAISELDTKKVSIAGAETVTGQKTFTNPLATADPTAPLGLSTKQYVDNNTLTAFNGKSIPLAADTNLEAWANGLPASGLYNVQLTVAQGNLPARFWYIELMRHGNDNATNLYHTMRATSLNLGSNIVYINTCQAGVWSGWVECGVNRALTWYTPTLVNGWASHPTLPAKYAQDSMGTVYLAGLVTNGSNSTTTTIFTLPSGMRPTVNMRIAENTGGGVGSLSINTAGDVRFFGAEAHTGNATTWLAIQAVFKGEQ